MALAFTYHHQPKSDRDISMSNNRKFAIVILVVWVAILIALPAWAMSDTFPNLLSGRSEQGLGWLSVGLLRSQALWCCCQLDSDSPDFRQLAGGAVVQVSLEAPCSLNR
jgi:hypothetical protein